MRQKLCSLYKLLSSQNHSKNTPIRQTHTEERKTDISRKFGIILKIIARAGINSKSSVLELSILPTNPSHLITFYKSRQAEKLRTHNGDKKSMN